MKILRHETLTEAELLARLKETRLKGHGRPRIYEHSPLALERVDPNELAPAQRYVLRSDVASLRSLYEALRGRGIDALALRGGVRFWIPGEDSAGEEGPIPLIPPVVEESAEADGRTVLLINDGMHRVFLARELGCKINVVIARNVPRQFPYYAFPLMRGWAEVVQLDELPDGFMKKKYRDEQNYKALFRDFNELFPGVQKQRKQSNPAGLKA
jgi:hypothetical protein